MDATTIEWCSLLFPFDEQPLSVLQDVIITSHVMVLHRLH